MRIMFEDFELDTDRRELTRAGAAVAVEPQVFDLLVALIEHRARVLSKDEIIDLVWGGRIVSDAAVSSRIKSARQALGDDGKTQRLIKTIHGRGVRFVGAARVTAPTASTATAAPSTHASAHASAHASPTPPRDAPDPPLEAAEAPLASKPSIAILPFQLIGEPGPYAAIADALPHDLITELARLRWLFVIARGSSFRFRGADVDLAAVQRALGARYGVTGAVELVGDRMTITLELADCASGVVIWADRQEGPIDQVHEIRARAMAQIVSALELQITAYEAERARLRTSDHLDAWSSYHLGLQRMYRFTPADNAAAQANFARAVALDPSFARAHAGLSFTHFQNAFLRYADDTEAEKTAARRAAETSVALDERDPFANFVMGRSIHLAGDLEGGGAWLDRAATLSPNYAQALYARAWVDALLCRGDSAQARVDGAMALSPLDPMQYAMLATRALSHFVRGDDAEAARWADRAARAPGAHAFIKMIALFAHAAVGDQAQADHWASILRHRGQWLTQSDFFRSFPFQSEEARARIARALTDFDV